MAGVFDRRRIAAPETSAAPIYDGPSQTEASTSSSSKAIFLKTGLTSQANGSGYIESGGVKIACSVYGPRPKAPPYTPQGTLNLEIKFAPFASNVRRTPLKDTEPLPLAHILTQLLLPALQLHLLPKSSIDLFILVLESANADEVLSAGLTVASAALADAGIPMSALPVGESIRSDVDSSQATSLIAGFVPALDLCSNLVVRGQVEDTVLFEMLDRATTQSRETHAVLAASLLESYT